MSEISHFKYMLVGPPVRLTRPYAVSVGSPVVLVGAPPCHKVSLTQEKVAPLKRGGNPATTKEQLVARQLCCILFVCLFV